MAVLHAELEDTSYGIVFLTPENLKSPWLLFEAGALSGKKDAKVCVFLFDLEWSTVEKPLSEFHHTENNRDHIEKLVRDINNRVKKIGETGLEDKKLDQAFEQWWSKLEAGLKETPPATSEQPKRTIDSKIDELLEMVRNQQQGARWEPNHDLTADLLGLPRDITRDEFELLPLIN